MINKERLLNPIYFGLLMAIYGMIMGTISLFIGHLFEASYSFSGSGGLVGALLAGTTFVHKRRELPSLKLRLYACGVYACIQVLLNIIFLSYYNLEIDNFWKLVLTINIICIIGVFFMVSLGAINHYKSLKRLEKSRSNEQ